MRNVEVCLTPDLIHQHDLDKKIIVVVDIFRATSCIVTGLSTGVAMIKPVATVEEALELGKRGYLMAGERGGIKVDGFDMGNSPFEYMDEQLIGRKIAISTTNGTITLIKSLAAEKILIGAFLNLSVTADYLLSSSKDIVIHCAGWKGTVNLEDTLYAGALIEKLKVAYETTGDSAVLAHQLYLANQSDVLALAKRSGHAHRLVGFGIKKDIEYCVKMDEFDSLVGLKDDQLVIV